MFLIVSEKIQQKLSFIKLKDIVSELDRAFNLFLFKIFYGVNSEKSFGSDK